jgi:hypothetical protein
MVVLAMVPAKHKGREGVGAAMAEVAMTMLKHRPDNWLSRNFTEIAVPGLEVAQGGVEWLGDQAPDATSKLLMRTVAHASSAITAVYTDLDRVVDLLKDLHGEWLANIRRAQLPISIVVSGLFHDVHKCCQKTDLVEHTFLHSLGFHGRADLLPGPKELELITMCGHGLISVNRVETLVAEIREGATTPRQAADNIARPCICGIVNRRRAEEVLQTLARAE